MNRTRIIFIAFMLVALGIASRLFSHAPNATALTAIALVSSLYLGNRFLAFIIPTIALLLSDTFIGFYDVRIMASVYISFAVGWSIVSICRKKGSFGTIIAALTGSSFLFFVITNAAVWFFSPWYEKNIAGLFYAYEMGLPFLRNMFVGDMVYSLSLIAIFEFVYLLLRFRQNRIMTNYALRKVS